MPDSFLPDGLLVVFEGIDGAGKSTQIAQLLRLCEALRLPAIASREPTYGQYGRQLRESAQHGRLPALREHELLMLDRREHLATLILPALARGSIVILDRYYFSSVAYQSGGELDANRILADNEAFARPPELLLLLDLPVETSLARIGARTGADAFESHATLTRCRDIYLKFADLPYARVIDAAGDPAAISGAVSAAFLRLLAGHLLRLPDHSLRAAVKAFAQA